jgi:hypothetical protein
MVELIPVFLAHSSQAVMIGSRPQHGGRMRVRSCLGAAVVCALQLWIPNPTSAQAAPGFRAGTLVLFSGSGFERAFTATDVRRIRRAGGNAVIWGAIAGAGIAALATAGAASAYGRNEGGGFCTRCFVQWAAASVPVGVALGAGIGWSIEKGRRTTLYLSPEPGRVVVAPLLWPGGAGLVVSARF